jgi:hypothetical protein
VARIDSVERLKGELVRAIDLPAQVHDRDGIFESLPPEYTGSLELVEEIEAECRKNYGVALREFVRRVAENAETIEVQITTAMQEFFDGARVPKENWEYRFAKRFALAYAAAILAVKFDVVPWDSTTVARAIKSCYLAARSTIPDADRLRYAGFTRLRAQLSGAASIVDLVRSGNKVQWSAEQIRGAEVFRRSGPTGVHYLVQPKTFDIWFDSPLQANLVLAELDQHGHLIKAHPNLRTIQVAINGINGRRRYYAIREAVLSPS